LNEIIYTESASYHSSMTSASKILIMMQIQQECLWGL